MFAANSSVSIYYVTTGADAITDAQANTIRNGWANVASGISSNVTFALHPSATYPVPTPSTSTAYPSVFVIPQRYVDPETGQSYSEAFIPQFIPNGTNNLITSITLYVDPQVFTLSEAAQLAMAAHEGLHLFGLGDCEGCDQTATLTARPLNTNLQLPTAPTPCDVRVEQNLGWPGAPPPPPPPAPGPNDLGSAPYECLQNVDPLMTYYQYLTLYTSCTIADMFGWDEATCSCKTYVFIGSSPIIIDVAGTGFRLTDAAEGVSFDLNVDVIREKTAWTEADSRNAFLVLDTNGNGLIDHGQELFGNLTPQPACSHANGFLALAEYDKAANGGNEDGLIDSRDSIFTKLRLWVDSNHDGFSSSEELFKLPELSVYSISLDYRMAERKDSHGNEFRYRAKINEGYDTNSSRWAYDVFLVRASTAAGQP
jgi:hypothetical protein